MNIDLNHFREKIKKYNLLKSACNIFVYNAEAFLSRVFRPKSKQTAEWANKFRVSWRSTMQIKH